MNTDAIALIDSLGGTTKVARLIKTPVQTVNSWRLRGIPSSRLAHINAELKLAEIAARDAQSQGAQIFPYHGSYTP